MAHHTFDGAVTYCKKTPNIATPFYTKHRNTILVLSAPSPSHGTLQVELSLEVPVAPIPQQQARHAILLQHTTGLTPLEAHLLTSRRVHRARHEPRDAVDGGGRSIGSCPVRSKGENDRQHWRRVVSGTRSQMYCKLYARYVSMSGPG